MDSKRRDVTFFHDCFIKFFSLMNVTYCFYRYFLHFEPICDVIPMYSISSLRLSIHSTLLYLRPLFNPLISGDSSSN